MVTGDEDVGLVVEMLAAYDSGGGVIDAAEAAALRRVLARLETADELAAALDRACEMAEGYRAEATCCGIFADDAEKRELSGYRELARRARGTCNTPPPENP